jgi:hypothetical protein
MLSLVCVKFYQPLMAPFLKTFFAVASTSGD